MALFDPIIANNLGNLINIADATVRADFNQGYVVDENDYTSNLTSLVRKFVNIQLPLRAASISQKLPANLENSWGVDACVILIDHDNNQCKLCLFEAKTNRNNWDYLKANKHPNVSHFSTQLSRQVAQYQRGFSVWEQFYCDAPNMTPVGKRSVVGSSCVLHSNAISHNAVHPNAVVWDDSDIDVLCSQQLASGMPISMGGIVRTVCECFEGKAMTINDLIIILEERLPVKNMLFVEGGRAVIGDEEFETIGEKHIKNLT